MTLKKLSESSSNYPQLTNKKSSLVGEMVRRSIAIAFLILLTSLPFSAYSETDSDAASSQNAPQEKNKSGDWSIQEINERLKTASGSNASAEAGQEEAKTGSSSDEDWYIDNEGRIQYKTKEPAEKVPPQKPETTAKQEIPVQMQAAPKGQEGKQNVAGTTQQPKVQIPTVDELKKARERVDQTTAVSPEKADQPKPLDGKQIAVPQTPPSSKNIPVVKPKTQAVTVQKQTEEEKPLAAPAIKEETAGDPKEETIVPPIEKEESRMLLKTDAPEDNELAAPAEKEEKAIESKVSPSAEEPSAKIEPLQAFSVPSQAPAAKPVPTVVVADAATLAKQTADSKKEKSKATTQEKPAEDKPEPVKKLGEPVKGTKTTAAPVSKGSNLFAEQFLMSADQRIKSQVVELNGFLFLEKPALPGQPKYFIVTQFAHGAMKSRPVPGPKSLPELRKWIDDNLKTAPFQEVEVKRLPFADSKGGKSNLYWIGNKAFESTEKAKDQIVAVKTAIKAKGENFTEKVAQAQAFMDAAEAEPKIEIKSPAQYEREERIALKFLDQLDVGNKLFGPFQGRESGEPIVWQSFGETSFRTTNIEKKSNNIQVGYWTNRFVFKGFRAPFNTIDPFVEVTPSLESSSPEYKSNLKVYGGLEWRPLERNAFINNFRPYGLPLLDWCRNWRFFVQYGDRYALKDEIQGSKNYNLVYGAQIFYEWGVEVPGAGEGVPIVFADYLREFVWGEYYGDYHWESTNFGSEKIYDAWVFNSTLLLGFRLPGIPLPQNPINDRLVLMPYMKFEHVNNSEFSFRYQNRVFMAAGVRWMPFRTYKFKENEWLAKMKIFIEYDGVGGILNPKQGGNDAYVPVQNDLRIGVNISSRRY